jgi:type II secretory pathway pseudopilin PulG
VKGGDRLGRMEVLGAWLRLWTPPRDAVVPPVPRRAIAVATVVLVAVLGVAAALLLPGVAADRRAARERAERAQAERHAAFLASVDREQRPRIRSGRRDPGPGAPAGRRVAARQALVAAAAAGIERDARGRTPKRIDGVECEPFPRTVNGTPPATDLARTAAAYDCVAVTSRFENGIIGMSFRLVADFQRGSIAWCRIVPLGDRDRLTHPLPGACRQPAS